MYIWLNAYCLLQAVVPVIKPDVEAQQIPDFLWGHVNADLNNLQRVLGCSIDDIFILMHSIINNIMITHNQGKVFPYSISIAAFIVIDILLCLILKCFQFLC